MFYASGGVYPPAFTSLTFLHLVGAGVPDGPHRRTAEYRRTLVYPSVGAGVPDGPFFTLPSKEYSALPSAGHFWPQPQK